MKRYFDARASRSDNLFFYAADREHETTQADLARHRNIAAHTSSGEQGIQRDEHGNADTGAIFRSSARWSVNLDIALLK